MSSPLFSVAKNVDEDVESTRTHVRGGGGRKNCAWDGPREGFGHVRCRVDGFCNG